MVNSVPSATRPTTAPPLVSRYFNTNYLYRIEALKLTPRRMFCARHPPAQNERALHMLSWSGFQKATSGIAETCVKLSLHIAT